ncbi:MAG: hypothetical protein Q8876_04000 [Bacillota bacterium]|nr:hypothetical protein [Bacillota bacterium]
MKDIIEELYFGNIKPLTNGYLEENEYKKLSAMLCETEAKVLELLDEKGKELFEYYIELQDELLAFGEKERFKDGFKIGAEIMVDTFVKK